MTCKIVGEFAGRSIREIATWFVESADGRGPLADLRRMLERGIRPEWALPLDRLQNYLANFDAEGAYVVDDLGLSDAVALFKALARGGYFVTVKCFFNQLGKTWLFKRETGASTLIELSKGKYAEYLGVPDASIHTLEKLRLSKEGGISVVAEHAEYVANLFARSRGGLTATSLAIVSDHGYDVLKDGDRYYLAHGPYAFSKLAFLIVAHRI